MLKRSAKKVIDWRIDTEKKPYSERGWFFPSFEVQEMLLPLINAGCSYIDEYGGTSFGIEDCKRIKGNVEYLIDSEIYRTRKEIRFDTFGVGLVTLSCEEIVDCLMKLHEAADQAIGRDATLRFYGD